MWWDRKVSTSVPPLARTPRTPRILRISSKRALFVFVNLFCVFLSSLLNLFALSLIVILYCYLFVFSLSDHSFEVQKDILSLVSLLILLFPFIWCFMHSLLYILLLYILDCFVLSEYTKIWDWWRWEGMSGEFLAVRIASLSYSIDSWRMMTDFYSIIVIL